MVKCYRNLHKNCISIQKKGLVIARQSLVVLRDFKTLVSQSGRRRVLSTKRKNVHSFLVGEISDEDSYNSLDREEIELYYNPYETDAWMDKRTKKKISSGLIVLITPSKVLAKGVKYED